MLRSRMVKISISRLAVTVYSTGKGCNSNVHKTGQSLLEKAIYTDTLTVTKHTVVFTTTRLDGH